MSTAKISSDMSTAENFKVDFARRAFCSMKLPQTGGISYKKLFKILKNPIKFESMKVLYTTRML